MNRFGMALGLGLGVAALAQTAYADAPLTRDQPQVSAAE